MTAWQATLFVLFVVGATFAQALTGFAFVLVLLGLAALFELAPLTDLTNVATTLSVISAFAPLRKSRRLLDAPAYRQALAGSALGVVIGVLLLAWLSTNTITALRGLLGLTIGACALAMLRPAHVLPACSRGTSFGAFGVLSGLLGGLFSAGGPPLVYQFYRQPMPVDAVRATLLASLTSINVVRLVAVVATGQFSSLSLQLSAFVAPVVLTVSWLLQRYPLRWPRDAVLKLVSVLLLATGSGLVASAWRA